MAEITLGQYYPENSIIHKLDPRVKLFGTLIFIIAIFSTNNIIGLLAIVMFLAIIIFTCIYDSVKYFIYPRNTNYNILDN